MTSGRQLNPDQIRTIVSLGAEGFSAPEIAGRLKVNRNTVSSYLKKARSGKEWRDAAAESRLPPPIDVSKLNPAARRSLDDFDLFRRRYMGHISPPWQVVTAETYVELLASPHKEYVVENVSPGTGKTTLIHDIAAWLTVRDRSIRGLFGSNNQSNAARMLNRLRRTFERTVPVKARDDEVRRGTGCDAEATLAGDFGRFKPWEAGELWRQDEFVVAQKDDVIISERESTWTAYGLGGGFLGNRFNVIFWDDVVDKSTIRTIEAIERQRADWDDEAETRLEPGGLLALIGQRLHADDLYRYCLNKTVLPDDTDDDDLDELLDALAENPDAGQRMYRHIVFRAHYEDRCRGKETHKLNAPAYDPRDPSAGCLLDPLRLPWRDLRRAQGNASRFATVYQQEDVHADSVLVPKIWVDGGRGADGVDYPGCWDNNRGACELPSGLVPPLISVAVADPSPTRFWSVQHWVYHPASEQRFLLDLVRQAMDAPDFLDWDQNNGIFTGVMEEWQQRSRDLGIPITTWIVEANAAQRFLLQYSHVKRWQALRSVHIIPHQTHRNKTDPEFGVQTIAPHWRHGRVRLPGSSASPGRLGALKLVDEVTRWPAGSTDDCVMAEWMFEWNLPRLYRAGAGVERRQARPTWLEQMNGNRSLTNAS